jgi:hypothetical protein
MRAPAPAGYRRSLPTDGRVPIRWEACVGAGLAAETLAAYQRGRIEQTLGARQAYHQDIARRCLEDVEDAVPRAAPPDSREGPVSRF